VHVCNVQQNIVKVEFKRENYSGAAKPRISTIQKTKLVKKQ
jgi:hypothetical protein